MRADFDQGCVDSRLEQAAANGVGAPEPQLVVTGVGSRGVGVADDGHVGKRTIPDGLQNLRQERATLVGELLRLETKVQKEDLRRRRERREHVAKQAL